MDCPRKPFQNIVLFIIALSLCATVSGASITSPVNGSSYLYSVTAVTLQATPNSGQFSCADVPASVTLTGGGWIFNPSVAGIGSHEIHYSKTGAGGYDISITLYVIPAITFSPTKTSFCQEGANFGIDGYTGAPEGGTFTFSGSGVVGSTFYPALAGPGSHTITATYTLGGTSASATAMFNVRSTPAIELLNFVANQCQTAPDYTIVARNPTTLALITGGTYTGKGITDNADGTALFSPMNAGLGFHNITYTYTDANTCTAVITKTARVGTEIFIEDLPSTFCLNDPADIFSYSPVNSALPVNRVSGPGVTDNLDGTASFDPKVAGVGIHTITYTFEDPIDAFLTCTNIITKTVQVYAVPSATFSGFNAAAKYCSGSPDVLLTGSYAPSGVFSGDGITDNGNGTATFRPSGLGVGTYSVTYTYINGNGCSDIETKNVEIVAVPTAFDVTGGGSRCESDAGMSVGLSNSVTGINYKLYRDGTAVVPDNTKPGSTGDPIDFGEQTSAGTYTVIATNPLTGCSSVMSGNAIISVNALVQITKQPVDATICEDGSVAFTVETTGIGRHYQWYNDGDAVGVDNNVLILGPVPLTEDGSEIYCVVTSSCGAPLTSAKAKLAVTPLNKITSDPSPAMKCTGGSVAFSITAEGTNNIYQWKIGSVNIVDIPGRISGSKSAVLTITNLTTADAGLYSCEVTGDCGGSVSSTQALLTVSSPVVITSQPSSVTACIGTDISFSTTASASATSFQWWFDDGVNPPVTAGTGSNLIINDITAADAGTYYCIISNECGQTVQTNKVSLAIPAPTSIATDPTGGMVCQGGNYNFSVAVTGSSLSYEWYKDGSKLSDGGSVSNSSTSNLTLTGVTTAENGNYLCVVKGSCGTETSASASLFVEVPAVVTTHPSGTEVCPGSSASFSVVASGTNLRYEWQKDNLPIGGATGADYTIASVAAGDAATYRCRVYNSCGSTYSTAVNLGVNSPVVITLQPADVTICENLNASFSVTASGTGLSYQWYNAGGPIAAATNSTLVLPGVTPSDASTYYCVVKGTCTTATSLPAKLIVHISPVISVHPVSGVYCAGMSTDLSVVVPTGSNLTYQWIKDGAPVGTNSPVYSIASFAAGDAGVYQCNISNICGTVSSNPATLTTGTPVSITTSPAPVSACSGGNATFTVSAAGSGVSYQWQRNGTDLVEGGKITGSKGAVLTISAVTAADAGSYRCIVTNSCGNLASASAALTVSEAAVITGQPSDETGCIGSAMNIVVAATGTNLKYQWYKDGAPIGLDNPVYAITSYVPGDAGTYRCEITNGCGKVISEDAHITTGVVTDITDDPQDASGCTGSDVNFTVTATGSDLKYLWKKDGLALSDDGHLSGTQTASFSITGIQPSDIGTYTCDVIGACGIITSNGAVLTVRKPVSITVQPENLAVCSGGIAIFDVVATGDNLTYSWQKDGVAIVPAESGSSLVITGAADADEGVYNCVVSNGCSMEISTSAELIAEDNLDITTQPSAATACEGTNVTFSIVTTGPTARTFRWYKDGTALSNGGRFSGVTSEILNINALLPTDNGSYSCRISSLCGEMETDIAVLTVQQNVSVLVQPASFSVLNGSDATFTVVASGDVTGYQWRKDGTDLADGGNITGATTATLTVSAVSAADQGAYTCYITGACNALPSNPATLSVLTSSVITLQPVASSTVCEGGTMTVFVTTSGAGHSYQWKKDGVNIPVSARISGITSSSLTVSAINIADQGAYTCVVDGSEQSSPSLLLVNRTTVINTQPLGATKCEGDFVTFAVGASGSGLAYQWKKDGGNIAGATSATYTIDPVADGDDGVYTCVVTGICDSRETSPAVLVVNKNTVITVQPIDPPVTCEGSSTTISLSADGDNLTYQWKKNGSAISNGGNISGADSPVLSISNALTTDAGIYSCTITGSCGTLTSDFVNVVVNAETSILVQPIGRDKCEGDNVTFTVAATGSNLTYKWRLNGSDITDDGITTGSDSPALSISPLSKTSHEGTYTCMVSGACGDQVSDPAVLTVNGVTTVITPPAPLTTICQNASTTISFVVSGGHLNYQWMKNGTVISDAGNISGTQTANLVISNALPGDAGFYSCTVTGTCGQVTSSVSVLKVDPLTVITANPVSRTLCSGDNVEFSVTAVGSNLTYKWKKDGVDIMPLVTTSVLNINNLDETDAGAYTCEVTGSCGTQTSSPASLVVNPPAVISIQPVNTSVCQGTTAILSVTATGAGALSYRWYYNGGLMADDGRITGSGTSQLRIAGSASADQGVYKCEISGSCGVITTNSVTLTVDNTTTVVLNPLNQQVVQGTTAVFSVSVTGVITGYQWQKNGVNLTDGGNISGATGPVLNVTNVTNPDNGSYRCVITGKCGNVTSDPGILSVIVPVSITSSTPDLDRCSGESASFSVVATGTIVSYQWTFNGSNLSDNANITGTNTANLVISSAQASEEGTYSCTVTGSFNISKSPNATLTVNEPAKITLQPLSQNLCPGDWLILEVSATGENLSYEWEKDGVAVAADANTTGIHSQQLIITGITDVRTGAYRCRVWNSCKEEYSNTAVIVVKPALVITDDPKNDTKCEGLSTSFSVTATGSGLTYQWYKGGDALSNSARITGAQSASLTISNLQLSDQDSYSCIVSDNCNSAGSSAAILSVRAKAVITGQPQSMVVCEGENAYFETGATGYDLHYQWQKDGAVLSDGGNISGSTTSVLVVNNASTADAGTYRCLIDGYCNDVLSNTTDLKVNPLPVPAGTVSGSTVICQGSKKVLYVVPEIANATSYVWTLPYGATIVSGAGTRSIEVDFAINALTGDISVHGINGCSEGAESPDLHVTINTKPASNAGPDQILCSDATVMAANITASGVWTKLSGQATIVNPNASNTSLTGVGQGENVFVWTVTESGCTSRDTVKITNKKVYVNAGEDQTICSMSAIMNANQPAVGSGVWSIVSGGAAFSNQASPESGVTNLNRGVNVLRWSIDNGGCISSDDVSIRNDLPTNSMAGRDTILLVNNYTLKGNNPAIGTGRWTLVSGSAAITNPSQYNTTVTGLGIGENILQWTITNNLCSSRDEVKVVNYTPTFTDAGPGQTLCSDQAIMAGTRPTYGTGQWSVIAGSGTFIDPSRFDTRVTNIGKGTNIFRWTIYEYTTTFDDVVIINNSPSNANAGVDQRVCGSDAVLAANSPLVGSGTWTLLGGSGTVVEPLNNRSAVSNLGSGSNTFRWTVTNGGCTSYDEVMIINDQPTVADAGVDITTCQDSVILSPNTPTVGTGEWSVVQGSAFFSGNKAFNLSKGENHLKWTISNNGCTSSDIVVITSNKPTTSFTGDDKSICVDSVFLPGNTPVYGTGAWTVLSGSGNIDDIHDPKSKVTNLGSGRNNFRWTITYNGCVSTSEVNINYDYIRANAGEDQVLCQSNALLDANNPGAGTGQWSVVGGSGSANFSNPVLANTEVTSLDKGINVLKWTITNSGCISSDEVVVANNKPSDAYAGSDRSVCGEQITLNANNPAVGTGEWSILSGSATIDNPAQNNSLISNFSMGRNVLRWTVTNQGCVTYDEVVINNDQPRDIEAGFSQYICSDSAQLYATAPVSGYGRWSILKGSATFEDNSRFDTKVYNLERGENKLVWTVTSAGCSNFDSVTVVNNLPSTPNAGPDQDICADNVLMAANMPLIGTGHWSVVSGSTVFEERTRPGTRTNSLGNGDNILRWTITNGSCTLYDEVTITNSQPTLAYAGEDRSVCNTSANLLATAPLSGTGSWSVVSGYGIFTDPNAHNAQITSLGFGQNTLRWTTEKGQCRTSDDVIITNNLADVYAGPDQVVYQNSTKLIGNKPSQGEGLWVVTAGNGTFSTPSVFETNVTGLGGGANTFNWTINNNGCIASDAVVITYRVLPSIDFNSLPPGGCLPVTVSFINTSVGGAPYTWDFGDGTTSSETNASHTYTLPGNYKVKLSGTGPDGILIIKESTVVVRDIPVADFDVTPENAYIPGNPVHFYNRTPGVDSLLWEFGDGYTSSENEPSHRYSEIGDYDVTLHVWSGFGCYDSVRISDAVHVEKAGIVKCPNAFTPNPNGPSGGNYSPNDYSNDVFHCYIEGVSAYHLEVYNRHGIRIFESNDVNIGWDGYFKGQLVEDGSYIFKVVGVYNNGQKFDYLGNIIVLH